MRPNLTDPSDPVVVVNVDARLCDARRRYGLEQLLQIIGARWIVDASARADLYYGGDPALGRAARVWVPISSEGNLKAPFVQGTTRLTEADGEVLPWLDEQPHSLWTGNRLNFDLGAGAAYWLTLDSEKDVTERDPHGRVPGNASVMGVAGRLEKPPVQTYARLLADRLREVAGFRPLIPLWPHGKRYAVALSHDVDAPERTPQLPLLLKELVFKGDRPRRLAYWDLRAEWRSHGFTSGCLQPPSRRSEWDFDEFCGLEAACGLRSAFYFGVANRQEYHPHDIHYHCNRGRYRRLFRSLQAGGWEVGLQAGYLTRCGQPSMEDQLRCLHCWSGCSIEGVRHHYLQLDPDEPMRTLASHGEAGLAYDTSVGFNDRRGFRAGTALPFHAFDPATGRPGSVVELPLTLSDMHLPKRDEAATVSAVLDHLRTVRMLDGFAMLNWHVGNWYAAPAWREGYRAACRFLATDSDAWVASPREVASWWNERARVLSRSAASATLCPAVA